MTLAEMKTAVANAYWDLDYTEFCRRAGFTQDAYAEAKWTVWLALAANLAAFDSDTLERIVQP